MYFESRSERRIQSNEDLRHKLRSIIRGIVAHGDSIDAKDPHSPLVLHLVAQYWGDDRLPDMVELKTFKDALHLPLNSASALALARLFLANGAQVNLRNRRRQTALYISVENDNLKMVSILLEWGQC